MLLEWLAALMLMGHPKLTVVNVLVGRLAAHALVVLAGLAVAQVLVALAFSDFLALAASQALGV